MDIKIIKEKISKDDLKKIAEDGFGTLVKAVVDIEEKIIALGGELHADANELLIENGSKQNNVWGINILPYKSRENWIEYIALINIRPVAGNSSMEIQNQETRDKIKKIVNDLIGE